MPCRHPLLKRRVASEGRDLYLQSEETSENDKRDGPSAMFEAVGTLPYQECTASVDSLLRMHLIQSSDVADV